MTLPGAQPHALAIDIGGTKMAGALVDAEGKVHGRRQVATAPDPAAALAQLVDEVLADVPDPQALAGVGAGCGGPMSWPAGVVNPLNIPSWRAGFPLRQWLRDRVPGPSGAGAQRRALRRRRRDLVRRRDRPS